MKSISNIDGLSRKERLAQGATVVPLQVLEDRYPILFNRMLQKTQKNYSLYQYQALAILAEIESFNIANAEEDFHKFKQKEQRIGYACLVLTEIDDWKKRLEYACINTSSLEVLSDLNNQISTHIAPYFSLFKSQYNPKLPKGVGKIWYSTQQKTLENVQQRGLLRRFFGLLLGAIRMLQQNAATYREEVCTSGMVDPSLAVMVAFLKNYEEIAKRFNSRWQELPWFYLAQMLKATTHPEVSGKVWLAIDKSPAISEFQIPINTYFPLNGLENALGCKLLSDAQLSELEVKEVQMIATERGSDRYPESALKYVTSIMRIGEGSTENQAIVTGIKLASRVLLLREGERYVSATLKLTQESVTYFNAVISTIVEKEHSEGRLVTHHEIIQKILSDSFFLEVSTSTGWVKVEALIIRFQEEAQALVFQFKLTESFTPLEPLEEDKYPSIRLCINSTSWMYPYSWARTLFVKSVHIRVEVNGIRDIKLYNGLGSIDANQPFNPFGLQTEKGAWMVFGNYEMATKKVVQAELAFDWQQIPNNEGGLYKYYSAYTQQSGDKITNRSFCAKIEALQNGKWKDVAPNNSFYLFRTAKMSDDIPEIDGKLEDSMAIKYAVSEAPILHLSDPELYRFGSVRSGFYRLTLTSPDIGFGDKLYQRIFAESMMYKGRFRRKKAVPEPPMKPLMNAPRLSYIAEEESVLTIGQSHPIQISHINPLHIADTQSDMTHPIPLLEGPTDEGNFIISFSNALGQHTIKMYIEMQQLSKEINHDFLPQTNWYFKHNGKWVKLSPSGILRDDTKHLMYSGGVELQLPCPVTSNMLDQDGCFRVCVSVRQNLRNCALIRRVYTNVVEAEVVIEPQEESSIPAVSSVQQITPIYGAIAAETREEMKIRFSERMSHRNRALLPRDYEQLILQHFKEIAKVKCIPSTDTKQLGRHGVVTLVLVENSSEDQLPFCEDRLLCKVEEYVTRYTSPFVIVDAINPIYEEVTVFCGVSISGTCSAGNAITEIRQKIIDCIAPWCHTQSTPIFGYSFSIRDLYSQIKESKCINKLHGIKFTHLTKDIRGAYYLNEEYDNSLEEPNIAPSVPWAILVPAVQQYVIICTEEEWRNEIEFGDLELERTFVIA